MVALSGPGWKLAPSLVAYVEEADRAYPNRDRTSDGSIGDAAHASRDSDHNPYAGFVHAVDLDEDLAAGLDLKAFAERLRQEILADVRARRVPRIRYLIYEGRTVKGYPKNGYPAGVWQPYTGASPHSGHLHLSIDRTSAARNDLRPWGFANEEDDLTPEEKAMLKECRDHLRHLDPFEPEKLNARGEKDAAGKPASRTIRWAAESLNKLRRIKA